MRSALPDRARALRALLAAVTTSVLLAACAPQGGDQEPGGGAPSDDVGSLTGSQSGAGSPTSVPDPATAPSGRSRGAGSRGDDPRDPDAPGPLSTRGARIVDQDGRAVRLRGVSWLGAETGDCVPAGLDRARLDDVVSDVADAGFTLLRIPFASTCLRGRTAQGVSATLNPAVAGAPLVEVLDVLVDSARRHGLRVLLANRPGFAQAPGGLWYSPEDGITETRWTNDWVRLAGRYAERPTVVGAELADDLTEAACWGCGDNATDWRLAAQRAGNAIQYSNPDWLIVVPGVAVSAGGDGAWWGSQLADVEQEPVELKMSDDKVVYAAHDFSDATFAQPYFSAGDYPDNLPALWDRDWGYLVRSGTAPVLVTKMGSPLATPSQRQWFETLTGYLDRHRIGFSWLAWNPNGADAAIGHVAAPDWSRADPRAVAQLEPLLR